MTSFAFSQRPEGSQGREPSPGSALRAAAEIDLRPFPGHAQSFLIRRLPLHSDSIDERTGAKGHERSPFCRKLRLVSSRATAYFDRDSGKRLCP